MIFSVCQKTILLSNYLFNLTVKSKAMKSFIIFVLSIFFFSADALAQSDIKTDSFKVEGNCGMCKKRIEEAAFVKGVKRTEWNKESHMLTVVYRSSKTNKEAIAKSVAAAGHSSEQQVASEKDYKKLPECCHYKTHICND